MRKFVNKYINRFNAIKKTITDAATFSMGGAAARKGAAFCDGKTRVHNHNLCSDAIGPLIFYKNEYDNSSLSINGTNITDFYNMLSSTSQGFRKAATYWLAINRPEEASGDFYFQILDSMKKVDSYPELYTPDDAVPTANWISYSPTPTTSFYSGWLKGESPDQNHAVLNSPSCVEVPQNFTAWDLIVADPKSAVGNVNAVTPLSSYDKPALRNSYFSAGFSVVMDLTRIHDPAQILSSTSSYKSWCTSVQPFPDVNGNPSDNTGYAKFSYKDFLYRLKSHAENPMMSGDGAGEYPFEVNEMASGGWRYELKWFRGCFHGITLDMSPQEVYNHSRRIMNSRYSITPYAYSFTPISGHSNMVAANTGNTPSQGQAFDAGGWYEMDITDKTRYNSTLVGNYTIDPATSTAIQGVWYDAGQNPGAPYQHLHASNNPGNVGYHGVDNTDDDGDGTFDSYSGTKNKKRTLSEMKIQIGKIELLREGFQNCKGCEYSCYWSGIKLKILCSSSRPSFPFKEIIDCKNFTSSNPQYLCKNGPIETPIGIRGDGVSTLTGVLSPTTSPYYTCNDATGGCSYLGNYTALQTPPPNSYTSTSGCLQDCMGESDCCQKELTVPIPLVNTTKTHAKCCITHWELGSVINNPTGSNGWDSTGNDSLRIRTCIDTDAIAGAPGVAANYEIALKPLAGVWTVIATSTNNQGNVFIINPINPGLYRARIKCSECVGALSGWDSVAYISLSNHPSGSGYTEGTLSFSKFPGCEPGIIQVDVGAVPEPDDLITYG